eukprot:332793-Pleurochrysis_carterae.AAC.1
MAGEVCKSIYLCQNLLRLLLEDVGRVRTRKYRHSRYPLCVLLNRRRPARLTRGSETRGSVPAGPGLIVPPPIQTRCYESDRRRGPRPLPFCTVATDVPLFLDRLKRGMGGNWRLRPPESVAFEIRTRRYEAVELAAQGTSQSEGSGSPASKFGPEGLNLADNPFPLSLGGVWWCSTPCRPLPSRFVTGGARKNVLDSPGPQTMWLASLGCRRE